MGKDVHILGHINGQLVHRRSANGGVTWTGPQVIASAAGNYPAMYGGLFAQGNTLHLITAAQDMAAGPRQLEYRKSADNGATWSSPVRITSSGTPIFRARIVANNSYVHVVGTAFPTSDAAVEYFRSSDGGATWQPGRSLATQLGQYGGGQTAAVDGSTVHVAYTDVPNSVGSGPTYYLRSTDNGASWSTPQMIGENTGSSSRQSRVQLAAADGRVFACWQREGGTRNRGRYSGGQSPLFDRCRPKRRPCPHRTEQHDALRRKAVTIARSPSENLRPKTRDWNLLETSAIGVGLSAQIGDVRTCGSPC